MKIKGRSSALWLNILMLALYLTSGGFTAALAQENALIGCWRHESEQGKFKNFVEICLGQGERVESATFKNGNGRGRKARWEMADKSTLSLVFVSDDRMACKFNLADSSKLVLSKCTRTYPNVFTRENTSGISTRSSICWGRQYPDNGDFEIAEIAARTPAIVELEHKQVYEDKPYAEADTVVVVWSRSGQYACVENLTDSSDNYFWVDQNALKSIPSSADGEHSWPGSYRRIVTIEITSSDDGKYDVYGKIEHTLSQGPGRNGTTSNEIVADEVTPQENGILVTLRKDITTAGSKAPKGVASLGFIDDHCKPILFVKGPVLLIKDNGDCGDGSVFEGYYLREL